MRPEEGIVQSFDTRSGEGTITLYDDTEIPFTRDALLLPDPREVSPGDHVAFVWNDGPDGPFATDVSPV